jgi:CPA2 family monovalent cation:H+ antiporter-2
MAGSSNFVSDLAVVVGVAAATTVVFQRLRMPTVLGYLGAGLIVGPYLPVPLFADPGRVEALSHFGVVLVMFAIGLEFRLSRLVRVLPVAGPTALIEVSFLMWCGTSLGKLLGWTTIEALLLGAAVSISSTMLVSKVYDQTPVRDDARELVLGMLVVQDVLAIALIAAMTAIVAGGAVSADELVGLFARLGGVLVAIVAIGLLVVPRLVRSVARLGGTETLTVLAAGLCFGIGVLAEELGFSVALGAFVAGVLVSESGDGERVERLITPIRDLFAAVFFVSIGMTVDPMLAWRSLPISLVLIGIVVLGQFLVVTTAGTLAGNGLRRSLLAGLSLGQIGEFGFILVAIGTAAGIVRPELKTVVVTVAVGTALSTPLVLRQSDRVLRLADRLVPARLQNLLCIYESWFERVRAGGTRASRNRVRHSIRALAVDAVVVVTIVGVLLVWEEPLAQRVAATFGIGARPSEILLFVFAVVLSGPFIFGLVRNARVLSDEVVDRALGRAESAISKLDTPTRRLLGGTIRLLVLLAVGAPMAALLRPLLPAPLFAALILAAFALAMIVLWRRAGDAADEIRSGASRLADAIARQAAPSSNDQPSVMTSLEATLPSLGTVERIPLNEASAAVGRTIAQVDLRALTGATILAVLRDDERILGPHGSEVLRVGDVLAVTGSREARHLAEELLLDGPPRDEPRRDETTDVAGAG